LTNKFLVRAAQADGKTSYKGHPWLPQENAWKHLVTFRTRTGDQAFNGFHSFVEDFRRDFKSVHEMRTARFSNGWVNSVDGTGSRCGAGASRPRVPIGIEGQHRRPAGGWLVHAEHGRRHQDLDAVAELGGSGAGGAACGSSKVEGPITKEFPWTNP
jgi:hypothetical protein